MGIRDLFLFCILSLAFSLLATTDGAKPSRYSMPFNRSSFPEGFTFGAGSAAYQSEGGAYKDGRGPSIWDTFAKNHPGLFFFFFTSDNQFMDLSSEKILDHSTGEIADDFYHLYKDDIKIMKRIGLDSFRFSLSWSRILPKGKISGGVNPLGVKFYNSLIDELVANKITPFITLFHFDLPQALEDEYGGFLSFKIVNDFRDYADFCFKTFGDRVKHWVTLNEPYIYSLDGYDLGTKAPGRCSKYAGNCTAGNSATEPYIASHNLILSHAYAVQLYKKKYQNYQKGEIGISLVTHWIVPKTRVDKESASRKLDFFFGWFADPITYGDYPKVMRTYVGNRLPKFTPDHSKIVKGSYDFLSVNYYSAQYASNAVTYNKVNLSYSTDSRVTTSTHKNGIPIGTPTPVSWLFVYPKGIKYLLLHVKERYKNPPVYITENGYGDANNESLPLAQVRKDAARINYHHGHLSSLLEAIKEGANVKGYYVWSFLDDFEWDSGYSLRFGIIYIDFKNNLKRYLKYSAYWFKMLLLH